MRKGINFNNVQERVTLLYRLIYPSVPLPVRRSKLRRFYNFDRLCTKINHNNSVNDTFMQLSVFVSIVLN